MCVVPLVGPSDCNEGLPVNSRANLSLRGALASGRVLVVVGEHVTHGVPAVSNEFSPQCSASKDLDAGFEVQLLGAYLQHLLRATGSSAGQGFSTQPAHSSNQNKAVRPFWSQIDSLMAECLQRRNLRE